MALFKICYLDNEIKIRYVVKQLFLDLDYKCVWKYIYIPKYQKPIEQKLFRTEILGIYTHSLLQKKKVNSNCNFLLKMLFQGSLVV